MFCDLGFQFMNYPYGLHLFRKFFTDGKRKPKIPKSK
jgi:hypothetical protein